MSIRSQDMQADGTRHPKEQTLFSWDDIDRALPWAKVITSMLGWGNSLITTMITGLQIEGRVYGHYSWVGALFGAGFAVFLTMGQIFTAHHHRWAYRCFLLPDAMITAIQWAYWILAPIALAFAPPSAAIVIVALASANIGIISARVPERLTFGK